MSLRFHNLPLRRAVVIIAVVGALSLAVPTAAFARSGVDVPEKLPPGFALISGTVRVNDKPLPGAQVHFAPLDKRHGVLPTTVRAFAAGAYSVRLPADNYLVTFTTDSGYAPAAWGDNNPVLIKSDVLDATKGGVFTGIDGNLTFSGVLMGAVGGPPTLVSELETGSSGFLQLFGYDPDLKAWEPLPGQYEVDANGAFVIRWLPPGLYKMRVIVDGYPATQLMGWSDQPAGTLSSEIQVGSRNGIPTVYNIELGYLTPPTVPLSVP
ncbi:hypothetical protein BH09ACT1_BH09ACT1_22880 [soil metagenome]